MEAEPITVTVPVMDDVALHKYVLELQPRIGYINDTGDSLFAKLYRTEEDALAAAHTHTGYIVAVVLLCVIVLILLYVIWKSPDPLF